METYLTLVNAAHPLKDEDRRKLEEHLMPADEISRRSLWRKPQQGRCGICCGSWEPRADCTGQRLPHHGGADADL